MGSEEVGRMKERFATEEWELVRCVPIQAFGIVAGADREPDPKEFEEFAGRMLRGAMTYKDVLHREVAQEFAGDDLGKRIQMAAETEVGTTRELLRSKLSAEEYQSYLGSIFIDALAVARAMGTAGSEISEQEQTMLAAFGLAWEIDLDEVKRIFGGT
jgi:hypothetical protein